MPPKKKKNEAAPTNSSQDVHENPVYERSNDSDTVIVSDSEGLNALQRKICELEAELVAANQESEGRDLQLQAKVSAHRQELQAATLQLNCIQEENRKLLQERDDLRKAAQLTESAKSAEVDPEELWLRKFLNKISSNIWLADMAYNFVGHSLVTAAIIMGAVKPTWKRNHLIELAGAISSSRYVTRLTIVPTALNSLSQLKLDGTCGAALVSNGLSLAYGVADSLSWLAFSSKVLQEYIDGMKWSRLSCKIWFAMIVLDFAGNVRKWCACKKNEKTTTLKLLLLSMLKNILDLLLASHWGSVGGVLSPLLVSPIAMTSAAVGLKKAFM